MITDIQLDKEEKKVDAFIKHKYPELHRTYNEVLPTARFMIMERLVNALLREGFTDRDDVLRQLNDNGYIELSVEDGIIHIPIARTYSYNRFELKGTVSWENSINSSIEITHPRDLVNQLERYFTKQGEPYPNATAFLEELSNSVANMGLVLLFQKMMQNEWKEKSRRYNWQTTIELVQDLAKQDELFDPTLFFEQLCVTGHQLHPGTKAKTGLSYEELVQYSGEFGNVIHLNFVAIHKDVCYHNPILHTDTFHSFWFAEYPELEQAFLKCCEHPKEYMIVPVHPWQYEHTLKELYPNEIENKDILFIPYSIEAIPTLSVRTVGLRTKEKKYHIKLPINIQMTSAVRTISPNSIHNGPELSQIAKVILVKESELSQHFHVIGEDSGLRFISKLEHDNNAFHRNKNLSMLLRKNPTSLLEEGEVAMVACALYNEAPLSEQLLLYEMIEHYNQRVQSFTEEESVLDFFTKYIAVLLSGVLPFMTRYGIGLEAHLQNTLVVFRDYEPVKVIVRDLGGVRVNTTRLEKQGIKGRFYPGSATIGTEDSEMQNKVIHTVFQSQIGELTMHLARRYSVTEEELWEKVKTICLAIFSKLKEDDTIAKEVDKDMSILLGETVKTKALTRMRLTNDVTDYAYISVPNPLCR
ncbi:IucA/IucC family protein [Bacillus alkalicellulosilyticus]|uniref:IucA/IucC family protein n=1 Tax=Alkalihalobacterium alkalicellulosilyticum TaxID=1912214 RepID=UPI001481FD25|nr:IucA/IucC family protein [Bacillus alkalicellulosilyticus]